MSHKIRLMEENELNAVAASLAKAFMNDPLQTYTFPDEEERRQRSPDHFKAFLQFGLEYGEVYVSQNAEGAVVWLRPGETETTNEKAEEGGLTKLPQLLGEDAANRFFSVLQFIDPFHQEDVPEPHWYVMVVGVDPAHQAKGLGQALLAPILQKAKANKQPVYLETAQPTNVPFYQKLNFKIIREVVEPQSGLKVWTFKRDH